MFELFFYLFFILAFVCICGAMEELHIRKIYKRYKLKGGKKTFKQFKKRYKEKDEE